MSESGEAAVRRAGKRASAFRTIGEVAEDLDLPAHVLRFWESKFPQLKPLKRGGGRRYYRPEDVVLLRRIQQCLYRDGYTIRGVQKLLREGGEAADSDGAAAAVIDDAAPSLGLFSAELARAAPAAKKVKVKSAPTPKPAIPRESSGLSPEAKAAVDAVRQELLAAREILRLLDAE